MLFTGNANPALAQCVAKALTLSLGKARVKRFSDGEINVEILEPVRGQEVFIFQSTHQPTNDNLMEIMLMADALRRASASRITAVIPYFGYARQDRRVKSARVPISAKVVADMLTQVGISRIITVDLHADQIQGFFHIPVDNAYSSSVLVADVKARKLNDLTVVSPDVGGVVRARAFAKKLDAELVIIDKRRPKANESQVMNIIGSVSDRHCLIVDDMVDTAGTLCQAARALKENAAKSVMAYCTHPILSGKALENIAQSELDELIVTDTIALTPEALKMPKIRQLSLAGVLAQVIERVSESTSLSALFPEEHA